MSSEVVTTSSILCPGIHTCLDDKQIPITHYLKRHPNSQNLVCGQGGCKFMYRDKDGKDIWQSNYLPGVIPTQ